MGPAKLKNLLIQFTFLFYWVYLFFYVSSSLAIESKKALGFFTTYHIFVLGFLYATYHYARMCTKDGGVLLQHSHYEQEKIALAEEEIKQRCEVLKPNLNGFYQTRFCKWCLIWSPPYT